jgi:hypothetical protein
MFLPARVAASMKPATYRLFLTFGEDEPKRVGAKRASLCAAKAVIWRPAKAPIINSRLATLSAIEQYHQMYGRTHISLKGQSEQQSGWSSATIDQSDIRGSKVARFPIASSVKTNV